MKNALIFVALFALTALVSSSKPVNPADRPVVVLELFTSQGCSSCPSADAALQAITQQATQSGKAVYGLSFHVDYWNRLGWQDPFSSKLFTDRQRQYDRALISQTYTPQIIVNGHQDLIGNQKSRIEQAIQTIQKQPAAAFVGVDGSVAHHGKQVTVDYELSAAGAYVVNVALVQKEARTNVLNGENGGRSLVNSNVVRQFRTIDQPGTSGSVTMPLPNDLKADQTAMLVYVQRIDNRQVVGAKQL